MALQDLLALITGGGGGGMPQRHQQQQPQMDPRLAAIRQLIGGVANGMEQMPGGYPGRSDQAAGAQVQPPFTRENVPAGKTRANYGPGPMGDNMDDDPEVDEGMDEERGMRPGKRSEDDSILDMIQQKIAGGADWSGDPSEGPSKSDLQYLMDNPTDGVISNFIDTFGEDALPEDMKNPDPDAPNYARPQDDEEDDED